jgi:hypothetical protein
MSCESGPPAIGVSQSSLREERDLCAKQRQRLRRLLREALPDWRQLALGSTAITLEPLLSQAGLTPIEIEDSKARIAVEKQVAWLQR